MKLVVDMLQFRWVLDEDHCDILKLNILVPMQGLDPIKDSDSYRSLFKELNEAFPNHVPLLSANLKKMDALEGTERTEKLPEIIKAAIQVQNQINQEQLAIFLARKTPAEGKGPTPSSVENYTMQN